MTNLGNIVQVREMVSQSIESPRAEDMPAIKLFPREQLLGVFCDNGPEGGMTVLAKDLDTLVRKQHRAPVEGESGLSNVDNVFTPDDARNIEFKEVEHPADVGVQVKGKYRRYEVYVRDDALRAQLKAEIGL